MQKTVIIIVGPTASGKTALSLQLAAHYKTSIISADSRQCYKELNIGVAKPPEAALQSIKHYFINSHSIHDNVNAQVFEEYALQAAEEIFANNDIAIMVGGTGMYIKAFCEGLDVIPEINASVRESIIQQYNQQGLTWLQHEVKEKDPAFWQQAEQQNPQRLMRALEVITATGISIAKFRRQEMKTRNFQIKKIGINLLKQQLHENINARVDEMISEGLVEEVRSLLPYKNINALQTVGYKEVFDYLEEKCSLPEAIEKIKTNTRQYAKRQLTWFKKDKEIEWVEKYELINRWRS
ncbi:tRNA (adenosine(37)-N6)-dimethylallyltransferase MiaA [Parafilimonas terrae]|uniref:tRNA dimethylallyltransferase n=1 Tax=Parafilimonas terrae TaxID=1465490 RepID=A0A1I5RTS8_9BACT|nr:tRNA (adenosine(37)-N6)-dimethylallyltransferase MiaA [Parafilimonas terrae]SFP61797.1 tRNA dimethylallyltransferase [Parafilimonas terrae]